MSRARSESHPSPLRILCLTQGQWGDRIASNIQAHAPADWEVKIQSILRVLPPIIDDPADFLPTEIPQSDLILALGEVSGLAQLVPEVARASGARSVIAPIDRNESLPPGLARQLAGWLEAMGVSVLFPRPFCSLTEESINAGRLKEGYADPLAKRFAAHFGKPELTLTVENGAIASAEVMRDSACGCARFVSEGLIGIPVEEAVEKAGMLHHHFPCLASMNQDPDYLDTLMHVSGNILKDTVKDQLGAHLAVAYLRPHGQVDRAKE